MMSVEPDGGFLAWNYRQAPPYNIYVNQFPYDPKGKFYSGQPGLHMGTILYTHGYNIVTTNNSGVYLGDNAIDGGTFPSWSGPDGSARVTFGDQHLYLVTDGHYYNCTNIMSRLNDLMLRINEIIRRLNYGWVATAIGATTTWAETGLTEMDTSL
jgi:hypothetical protein